MRATSERLNPPLTCNLTGLSQNFATLSSGKAKRAVMLLPKSPLGRGAGGAGGVGIFRDHKTTHPVRCAATPPAEGTAEGIAPGFGGRFTCRVDLFMHCRRRMDDKRTGSLVLSAACFARDWIRFFKIACVRPIAPFKRSDPPRRAARARRADRTAAAGAGLRVAPCARPAGTPKLRLRVAPGGQAREVGLRPGRRHAPVAASLTSSLRGLPAPVNPESADTIGPRPECGHRVASCCAPSRLHYSSSVLVQQPSQAPSTESRLFLAQNGVQGSLRKRPGVHGNDRHAPFAPYPLGVRSTVPGGASVNPTITLKQTCQFLPRKRR